MPGRKQATSRLPRPSKRTQIVWISFVGAMTLVVSMLWFGQSGNRNSGYIAGSIGPMDAATPDPIFDLGSVAVDRERWEGIIIHHLGQPAGDAERVHRLHQSYGYQGLGYHFLIGNGNGLGDGIVHVGYRWTDQLPGAHVARVARDADRLNERTIAICLIGNGDRRPFTPRQRENLATDANGATVERCCMARARLAMATTSERTLSSSRPLRESRRIATQRSTRRMPINRCAHSGCFQLRQSESPWC